MASCAIILSTASYRTKYELLWPERTMEGTRPARDRAPPHLPAQPRAGARGAVAVADAGGIAALTIRSLAAELGVKPMSVYHHVANKDEILDGIVDIVFSEIELPTSTATGGPRCAAGALGP